ncbi:GDNF family receptor alpha-like [Amia ocellicauda]|uniref:GDNF family receptor alpha-like n=1 Tax=Amia ocellicauda TaxID=2972642 RepID=UPI00346483A0
MRAFLLLDIQGSAPTPSRHTQHDWPGKLHAVKATTTTAKSCLAALQHCQESRHCSSLYNGLKDVCSTDNGQCDTPDIRHACLSTWRQLQSTALGDCSCAKRGRKKCLKIWSTLYNNSCIQNAQRSVGSSDTESDNTSQEQHNFQPEKDPTGLWELSALAKYEHRSSRSCSDVAKLCLEDEICNRELVPHVKACSESLNQCNVSQCQRAVQLFYDSLPSNVAEILVFCDCSPSDDKCLQVQGLLHSQFCSGQLSHTPTCLEVFDICIEDIFCRHRYKTFQDKCWGAGKLICDGHMGDDCSSYLDEHLMFSGEDACKAAFTGTMGTILQHPCTCYGLENAEELKCKQLHNVLHNRSHFGCKT